MARDPQRDVQRSAEVEAAALLAGRRDRSTAVVQPAPLSPLPLLLLAAIILIISLLAVDKIWELPLEQRGRPRQAPIAQHLGSAMKNVLNRPLHKAANGRGTASGVKPASMHGRNPRQPPSPPTFPGSPSSQAPLLSDEAAGEGGQPPNAAEIAQQGSPPPVEQLRAAPAPSLAQQARIRVLPSLFCQAVDPKLEAHCMAASAAELEPECKAAHEGQYSSSYLAPYVAIANAMRAEFGFINYQVEATIPGMGGEAERASGAWTTGSVEDADVIVLEEDEAHHVMQRYPLKKYIVVQHPAHATLAATNEVYGTCARTLLEDSRVLAYLQHTALQPLALNNLPRIAKSVHYFILNSTFQGKKDYSEILQAPVVEPLLFPDALLDKVYTLIPLIWRWRHPVTCHGSPSYQEWMTPALTAPPGSFPDWLPPLHERHVDVAFTGARIAGAWNKDPVTSGLYGQHRAALIAALERFKAAHPELVVEIPKKLQYSEFAQLLRRTKLFISPWGFGEYSGKDLEAVISRALLVKPLASIITGYPPIYEPNRTCLEVAIDFSDLESVVLSALADLPQSQQLADEAHRRLRDASSKSTVARDVAAMLHKVIV